MGANCSFDHLERLFSLINNLISYALKIPDLVFSFPSVAANDQYQMVSSSFERPLSLSEPVVYPVAWANRPVEFVVEFFELVWVVLAALVLIPSVP